MHALARRDKQQWTTRSIVNCWYCVIYYPFIVCLLLAPLFVWCDDDDEANLYSCIYIHRDTHTLGLCCPGIYGKLTYSTFNSIQIKCVQSVQFWSMKFQLSNMSVKIIFFALVCMRTLLSAALKFGFLISFRVVQWRCWAVISKLKSEFWIFVQLFSQF